MSLATIQDAEAPCWTRYCRSCHSCAANALHLGHTNRSAC